MGRKAFVNDLQEAALPGRFAQISAVTRGDDDGTLNFVFQPTGQTVDKITIDVMVSDVSDYPSYHTYFLFTTAESVPDVVNNALESIQGLISGRSIPQMLLAVPVAINSALSGGQSHVDLGSNGTPEAQEDEESAPSEDGTEADMWSDDSATQDAQDGTQTDDGAVRRGSRPESKSKIRLDIGLAKKAGFKIGVLGNLGFGGILCVSIRIAKLGISEEAIKAWGLTRNRYLVLLIRYQNGYKGVMEVKEEGPMANHRTEFRVALCEKYKPSLDEAINAFKQPAEKSDEAEALDKSQSASELRQVVDGVLEPLFIGRPLNELLRSLPALIKYRLACCFSWTAAEIFLDEIQAKAASSLDLNANEFAVPDRPASNSLPKIVLADHIDESSAPQEISLPLAAMQFVLRHFVRCTEFCLVCHCKVNTHFEALKPYVCSKPLCLFQYLALGFGPEIEWEILNQPYVVDLLISFCYTSAKCHQLRDFPIGIGLKVPWVPREPTNSTQYRARSMFQAPVMPGNTPPGSPIDPEGIASKFDFRARELILTGEGAPAPVKVGEWLVLTSDRLGGLYHARVEEVFPPNIRLGGLIHIPNTWKVVAESVDTNDAEPVGLIDVKVFVYNRIFDELPDEQKQIGIACLIDTLPGVMQMRSLLQSDLRNASLKRYRGKISDHALNLLRWIIASNRSCILQVDDASASQSSAGAGDVVAEDVVAEDVVAEDAVSGMKDWMQFRFGQGAPDKEQRFTDCVKNVSARLQLGQYPTLFAWHGSPLQNWHSIVREGLHFNSTANGRALGNGVYMSASASTSITYSGVHGGLPTWRNSQLQMVSVLALNEVVNAPNEYVCNTPHYVVSQLDWIQTRYLFVKSKQSRPSRESKRPQQIYQQDPRRTPVDENGRAITIPITAVSRSWRPVEVSSPCSHGPKRTKVIEQMSQAQAETAQDDAASVKTNASDLEVLSPEDGQETPKEERRDAATTHDPSNDKTTGKAGSAGTAETPGTAFTPGTLEAQTLPLLAPPSSGSTSATKMLMGALKQTLTTQASTEPDELGWHISDHLITNMYQWPLELHSFPAHLPLALDLQTAKLQSIVLEIRFGTSFPMSPPFIRVIRPRFLPFMDGGGGHVTAGGALCMELLTNSGWSAASSLESVLLQVRMAICSTDPRPARLMSAVGGRGGRGGGGGGGGLGDNYGVGEAVTAYKRACQIHGWQIPSEFDEFLDGKLQVAG